MPLSSVTDDTFQAAVLESDLPVLVDFTAAWCPPCRVMKPILDELAASRDDVVIVSVDVDANVEITARHRVLGMPTFVLFSGGAEVGRFVGARPKARLSRELDEALEPAARPTA